MFSRLTSDEFDNMVWNRALHIRSSRTIPSSVTSLLGLGSKFIPTPRPMLSSDFVQPFARLARSVALKSYFHKSDDSVEVSSLKRVKPPSTWTPDVSDPVVNGFLPMASKLLDVSKVVSISSCKGATRNPNLPGSHLRALSDFCSDPSFTICYADKNMGTCILDTTEYERLAFLHLSDTTTYSRVSHPNLAKALVRRFYSKLKTAFSTHLGPKVFESHDAFRYCTMTTPDRSMFPKFKLLIKLHKSPVVGRPLACSNGFITYHASKALHTWLMPVLTSITREGTIARDSISIVRDLEALVLQPDIVLSSKDIAALYPSIPIEHAHQAVREELIRLRDADFKFDVPIDLILEVLHLVLTTNIVNFHGSFYHQIKGGAMGTPAFVIIAVIFMYNLEKKLVSSFMRAGSLLYYKRFIDDIFTIFSSRSEEEKFYVEFNNLHPDIRALGPPAGDSAVWLDLFISKGSRFSSSGVLDLSVYQKNLNLFLYLPYSSYHPRHAKLSFITAEIKRYVKYCSSFDDYITIRDKFVRCLRLRGFPFNVIQRAASSVCYADRSTLLDHKRSSTVTLRPTLVLQHNPSFWSLGIRDVLSRSWATLRFAEHAAKFRSPPRVAFSNPDSLGNIVSKAYSSRYSF